MREVVYGPFSRSDSEVQRRALSIRGLLPCPFSIDLLILRYSLLRDLGDAIGMTSKLDFLKHAIDIVVAQSTESTFDTPCAHVRLQFRLTMTFRVR